MSAKRPRTVMHKDDLPLEQFVDAYQLFNRAVGKSDATLRWYESRLGHFSGFLGESPTLGDLTTDAAPRRLPAPTRDHDRLSHDAPPLS